MVENISDKINLTIRGEHFQSIFENSPIGIMLFDREGQLLLINKSCREILGLSEETDFKGYNFFKDPIWMPEIKEGLLKAESAGFELPVNFEEVKNSHYIPTSRIGTAILDIFISPIKVPGSESISGYLLHFQDVTERRAAEDELAREKNLLQVIMENTEAGLVYLDPEFNFVKVNSAYARQSRTSVEKLIGRNHFVLYPNDENEIIFKQVRDTGKPRVFQDKPFTYPDQPERGITYWDWTLTPVKDSLDKVQGLVLSLVETTNRKKLEQYLADSRSELEARVKERTVELEKLNLALNAEIKQHRQAKDKVSAIAASLRNLIQSIVDGALIINNRGLICFANSAAEKILDRRADELIGQLFEYPVVPNEQTEIKIVHGKGENISAEMHVVTVEWENERCYLATLHDITERKIAEDALRRSKSQLENLFNTMTEGVTLIDKTGIMIKANLAMERITGLKLDQLEGHYLTAISKRVIYPDNTLIKTEDWPVARVISTQQAIHNFEMGLERQDGSLVWLVVNAIPIIDNTGNFEGVVRTFSDVTEFRQMENIIKQNEAQLRLLLDQFPSMLWMTDVNLVITMSLGAGLRAFNLQPNHLVGTNLFEYYKTDNPNFPSIAAHKQALQGYPSSFELRLEGRIQSCYVEPLRDKNDTIIGVIGIGFDITDKARAEDALRALSRRLVDAQENERRNIARELHDEIGQSLTALKLMMSQTVRSSGKGTAPNLTEASSVVTELIRQVREMSLKLRPSMLDDLGLLPTLLWYIERYSAQTQIKVNFEHELLQNNFAPEINTAVYRIVQEALTNVARHAETKEATIRIWSGQQSISLKIEDHGKGFKPSALSSSASTGISGMRERVLLLGGKLNIETSPGCGTCLTAELPINDNTMGRENGISR